jgi:hypothetical protein
VLIEYLFFGAMFLLLLWGIFRSIVGTGISIEQAEEAAEAIRAETYEGRPARSPQEFAAQFYSDSVFPANTVELVFQTIVRAIGPEAQRIEPDDNLAMLYPGLDMADLDCVIYRACGCRWRGVRAIQGRIETLDDFVQIASRLIDSR